MRRRHPTRTRFLQPFNNVYNQPERDHFHTKAKYYRTDSFLVEHILDDATRTKLDQAWNDLLASFEYYDVFLRFTSDKFKLNLKKSIAELEDADIEALPAEPRKHVEEVQEPITWLCRRPSLRLDPAMLKTY